MFNRVILRRLDPAASGRADDIENEPLSPRGEAPAAPPQMAERRSRLNIPARFRFSSSTTATSAAGSDWPPRPQAAPVSQADTQARPPSSHDTEEEDDDIYSAGDARRQSTLPSRYSIIVDLPSTRLHLPGLQRTWTQGSNGPPTSRPAPRNATSIPTGPLMSTSPTPPPMVTITEPPRVVLNTDHIRANPSSTPRLGSEEADQLYPAGDSRSRDFNGADPAESQLADLAEDGRRRRDRRNGGRSGRSGRNRHRRRDDAREEGGERRERRRQRLRDIDDGDDDSDRPHPQHFLFCFPWIKSRKVRSQILQCFVSGIFLISLLSVYLALALTHNMTNSEFSVLLILVILFATIFFSQGIIRLCLLVFRPKPADDSRRNRSHNVYRHGGYAVPRQPIRVLLARDEEAAGIESETTKINPPAYGIWRESVRVDPNRIFWQRNTEVPTPTVEEYEEGDDDGSSSGESSRAARRPPSYASDDGVAYVIEARPRSMAPTMDIIPASSIMPLHPAEAGRAATPPSR